MILLRDWNDAAREFWVEHSFTACFRYESYWTLYQGLEFLQSINLPEALCLEESCPGIHCDVSVISWNATACENSSHHLRGQANRCCPQFSLWDFNIQVIDKVLVIFVELVLGSFEEFLWRAIKDHDIEHAYVRRCVWFTQFRTPFRINKSRVNSIRMFFIRYCSLTHHPARGHGSQPLEKMTTSSVKRVQFKLIRLLLDITLPNWHQIWNQLIAGGKLQWGKTGVELVVSSIAVHFRLHCECVWIGGIKCNIEQILTDAQPFFWRI